VAAGPIVLGTGLLFRREEHAVALLHTLSGTAVQSAVDFEFTVTSELDGFGPDQRR